jgi:hypothetical protein
MKRLEKRLDLETVSRPVFQRSRSREILVGLGLDLVSDWKPNVSVSKLKVSFTSLAYSGTALVLSDQQS